VELALSPGSARKAGFCSLRLERTFDACFASAYRTRLVGGAREPLYEPASAIEGRAFNLLHYREDYFASALHEVAHWCIAGPERRELVDFGYWYAPDGRGAAQQRAFERVECKPQALEWFFSKACARPFRVSVDNLDGLAADLQDSERFERQVLQQALRWQHSSMPGRALQFYRALCREFGTVLAPAQLEFSLRDLR
jgi:elongation factor P hydroxylase